MITDAKLTRLTNKHNLLRKHHDELVGYVDKANADIETMNEGQNLMLLGLLGIFKEHARLRDDVQIMKGCIVGLFILIIIILVGIYVVIH